MRILGLALLIVLGTLLAYGVQDLPARGDAEAPLHTRVATQYMERAYAETHTPNQVSAILADYRGYDTFGETVVIFIAGVASLLILRRENPRQ